MNTAQLVCWEMVFPVVLATNHLRKIFISAFLMKIFVRISIKTVLGSVENVTDTCKRFVIAVVFKALKTLSHNKRIFLIVDLWGI